MGRHWAKEKIFSACQAFIIAILAILQFTVILDFMVSSPLGTIFLMYLIDRHLKQKAAKPVMIAGSPLL